MSQDRPRRPGVLEYLVILLLLMGVVFFGVHDMTEGGPGEVTSTPGGLPSTVTPGGPTSTPEPPPGEYFFLPAVLYDIPAATSTPAGPPNN